jgi:hypothetical protein
MRKPLVNRRIVGGGGNSEFSAMGWGRILPVIVVLSAGSAAAQTPWPAQQQSQPQQQQAPWPVQQQQSQPQGQAAWPAQQPQQSQGQAAWPSQHQASMPGAPMSPMAAPGAGTMSPTGAAGGQPPPCFQEFLKLRTEVEKRGAAAKAGNERHVQREELCKLVSALSAASATWTKYTATKAKECGIPADAVAQIKGQDEHLAGLKKQICSAAATGPAAAPSLAEALGTDKMPLDENDKTTVKRGGVLDSLTGAPIR